MTSNHPLAELQKMVDSLPPLPSELQLVKRKKTKIDFVEDDNIVGDDLLPVQLDAIDLNDALDDANKSSDAITWTQIINTFKLTCHNLVKLIWLVGWKIILIPSDIWNFTKNHSK